MSWFEDTLEDRRALAQERLILEVTERIAEAMEERGVTQAELASRLGVSPSEISMRLRGTRNLTLRTVADMFDALGFDGELACKDRRRHRDWSGRRVYGRSSLRYTASGVEPRTVSAAS
jgi:transcriptional regulator with XRE-family HTH domain